ncbi:MAG: excisionase family DNA-binding protein [Phycisphaerales bacterium]|nr:MAG: excisionase family DNA-binding protein [Phycisphaerales bacterium]
MSVISVARKGVVKPRSGYLTTTELARLCGVSRFTTINWTKQGRIKATRTVGGHYRIPVSEALSLLRALGKKKKFSSSELKEPCRQQVLTTNSDEECGNCLTSSERNEQVKAKKKNILYAFGYGFGRGLHILNTRSKVK